MHQALFKMPPVSFPLSHWPKSTQAARLGFKPRQQNSKAHGLGLTPGREACLRSVARKLPNSGSLCSTAHTPFAPITRDVGVGVLQEPGGRWKIVAVSPATMHGIEAHPTSQPHRWHHSLAGITEQASGERRSTAICLPPPLLPSVHPSIHPGTPAPTHIRHLSHSSPALLQSPGNDTPITGNCLLQRGKGPQPKARRFLGRTSPVVCFYGC